ncbi:hypothetical protein MMC29_005085 [Sticta canariensis]|nr:hypothetical protein [Sticta canariensis]
MAQLINSDTAIIDDKFVDSQANGNGAISQVGSATNSKNIDLARYNEFLNRQYQQKSQKRKASSSDDLNHDDKSTIQVTNPTIDACHINDTRASKTTKNTDHETTTF